MVEYVITDGFGKVKSRITEVHEKYTGYVLSEQARKYLEECRERKK